MATMTHWSYDLVKDIALKDKNAHDNLEDLKSLLRDEIGSARNMCRIKNMEDLIDCLERHDALSEFNIEPLREIADQFGNEELEEAVSGYTSPKDTRSYNEPYNQYREQRLADEVRTHLNISGGQREVGSGAGERCANSSFRRQDPPGAPSAVTTPYPQALTDKKRAAIYKSIAENIGKFWRAFGRELEISQGQLDGVEMEYPRDLVSRVHKLLNIFEEDESHDPNQHVLILCRALEECRRKDLRRKVENIMSH
ncbi:fas-associated death domain protein [Stomoxys calcitrans]|uniref:Death domain-containing protein n=1 Tax=Stomoxys calcitrans TaxID=35570 RepID=A0A1I8NPT0_STOCA|nr:fas-associated death domain protein [Stomoxys calcitrans]